MSLNVAFSIAFLSSTSLIAAYNSSVTWPWSWDSVASWADFGIYGNDKPMISDTRAQFLADHYHVFSIEKCSSSGTHPWGNAQEAFYEATSIIRQFGSSQQIKILFYWSVPGARCDCYGSTPGVNEFCNSATYNPNSESQPKLDHSIPYVRQWWLNTMMTIVEGAFENGLVIDGVFLDGVNVNTDNNIALLLNETKEAMDGFNQKYGTNLYILGNGLWNYDFWPTHNVEAVPYVDGMMIEHLGAFEEVKQTQTGSYDPDKLLVWFDVVPDIINGKYGDNKSVFVKGIVGPAVWVDGVTWPDWYGSKPTTNAEWQNVSAELITFPLAVYLCGLCYKHVYFMYGWWYTINDGYVPCPESPESCYSPLHWYPELTNHLGAPLTDPIMADKYKCNRSFEHANVYVDLRVDTSGIIEWIPPTLAPTSSPTVPSVSPTEITMEPTVYPSSAPTLSVKIMNASYSKISGIKVVLIQIIILVVIFIGCIGYYCYKKAAINRAMHETNDHYQKITTFKPPLANTL